MHYMWWCIVVGSISRIKLGRCDLDLWPLTLSAKWDGITQGLCSLSCSSVWIVSTLDCCCRTKNVYCVYKQLNRKCQTEWQWQFFVFLLLDLHRGIWRRCVQRVAEKFVEACVRYVIVCLFCSGSHILSYHSAVMLLYIETRDLHWNFPVAFPQLPAGNPAAVEGTECAGYRWGGK